MGANALGELRTLLGIELCSGEWPSEAAAVLEFWYDVEVDVEH
jgi:hypothetical protein